MKYLDTCLAVQGIAQLKVLTTINCISMKETVASEGDEAAAGIIFSRLKSLELVNLLQLKSFCSIKAPLVERLEDGNGTGHWHNDLNSTIQHLLSIKICTHCFFVLDFIPRFSLQGNSKI
ncbi:Disease resistance protein RPS2 [Gossypium australe]|uniref:Disease resistance protein RPS2 n=1 Tax=Gossypium australe TaxID=47621 RepID=A0A5B6VU55_9ROSI|nr:Disease resistance protein RPS2 [Gossypium australe]